MKTAFVVLLFYILSANLFCQSYADSVSSFLSEYKTLSEKQGSSVWGYKFDSPVIFLDEKNELIYSSESLNHTKERSFKEIFISPWDSQLSISGPTFEFENKTWVVVDLPTKYDRIELMEFIAHETFHIIQQKLNIPASNPSLPHLSTIKGRTLMHLEIIELVKALKESQDQPRKIHLKNALALRTRRYAQFPDATELEGKCEMNEGMAEYTGRIYAGFTDEQLFELYQADINLLESIANEAAYPYFSGSLYAFLNDKSGKEWKNQLPATELYLISTSLFNIDLNDKMEKRADSLLNSNEYFDMPSRFSTISVEGLEKMFSKNLFIIPGEGSQCHYKSNIVVSIPNQGTVYNNVSITNEWGRLEVDKDGRVLISDNITLSSDSMSFEDNQVKGKNWILKLNPDWEVIERDGVNVIQKHN